MARTAVAHELLARLDDEGATPPVDVLGGAKLWVVSRALRLRRDRPSLFAGDYEPRHAHGEAAHHLVGFDRGGATTLATRLPAGLERAGGWGDTVVDVGETAVDVLTGREHAGEVALADVFGDLPVALLARHGV